MKTIPDKFIAKLLLLTRQSKQKSLEDYVGDSHFLKKDEALMKAIRAETLHSVVVHGPSGIGKTTIARLLAQKTGYRFAELVYRDYGRLDYKHNESFETVHEEAVRAHKTSGIKTALVLDEIHRVTRDQQEKVVEAIDSGAIVIIGTTVYKPDRYLIPSLLERIQIIPLMMHGREELRKILRQVLKDKEQGLGDIDVTIDPDAEEFLCSCTDGNAKIMFRFLEREVFRQIAHHHANPSRKERPFACHITRPQIERLANSRSMRKAAELNLRLKKKESAPSVIA